jgi:hypothetical protein
VEYCRGVINGGGGAIWRLKMRNGENQKARHLKKMAREAKK